MKTLRAKYSNGRIELPREKLPHGDGEVLVVFLDELERPVRTGKDFVEKWGGAFAGLDVEGTKDAKLEYLLRKHA